MLVSSHWSVVARHLSNPVWRGIPVWHYKGGSRSGPGKTSRSGVYKKRAPRGFPQGARESSGDLLSRIRGPGTIGDLGLNFRVRDGNGCDPHSITAETISMAWKPELLSQSPECRSQAGPGCPRGQTNRIVERKEKRLTGY